MVVAYIIGFSSIAVVIMEVEMSGKVLPVLPNTSVLKSNIVEIVVKSMYSLISAHS